MGRKLGVTSRPPLRINLSRVVRELKLSGSVSRFQSSSSSSTHSSNLGFASSSLQEMQSVSWAISFLGQATSEVALELGEPREENVSVLRTSHVQVLSSILSAYNLGLIMLDIICGTKCGLKKPKFSSRRTLGYKPYHTIP